MQRIPALDVFGTPKRMGIVEPPSGQAVQMAPAPVRDPFETALRFEIMDAEGAYIPGVAVSLVTENGTQIMTPGLSDAGGNVAVPVSDMLQAAKTLMERNPKIQDQKIYALVQGQGYEPVRILIYDPALKQTLYTVKRLHEVTLEKASEGVPPVVAVLGIAAVIGAIIWATKG